MKAIVYKGPWNIRVEEKEEPAITQAEEVIVEIHSTGICGTDLSIVSGEYSARQQVIIGHESAGIVVAKGSAVDNFNVGDRVIIDPTYYCGYCENCRRGLRNHCYMKASTEAGVSIDGTFTKYYKTTRNFIYPLHDEVPFEEGALSEPLSCVLTAIKKLEVTPFLRTAVLGGGPIGLLFCMALRQHGIQEGVLYESAPNRISLIEKSNALSGYWQLQPSFIPKKNQYDLIIDTTGSLLEASMQAITEGGKIALIGLRNNRQTINPREIADRSISIVGSIDSMDTFQHAVALINSRHLGLDKIITRAYSLEEFPLALSDLGVHVESQKRNNNISSLKSVIKI